MRTLLPFSNLLILNIMDMLLLHTLFIFTLYRAPVDTSPVTEGVTLFKHRLLLLLLLLLLFHHRIIK